MRPYGTAEQLEQRRRRALDLLADGQRPAQVAKRIGTTVQSVRRWRREFGQTKRKPGQSAPGHPSHLSTSQLRCLVQALQGGAFAYLRTASASLTQVSIEEPPVDGYTVTCFIRHSWMQQ